MSAPASIDADLLVHSAQVCTVPPSAAVDPEPSAIRPAGPQRGSQLGDLGIIADGAVAIRDGRIVALGTAGDLRARVSAAAEINAAGKVVTPGLVDPHTHLPWVGDRADEFEMRVAGASYMEIMAAGGGIMSTVRAVRDASTDELVEANLPRLDRLMAHGTTTLEMKTGYGLTTADELKQLEAIHRLDQTHPMDVAATFLGAHAVPAEYQGRTDAYVDLVVEEMLPAAAQWSQRKQRPLFCDVFCEAGVFDVDQSRRILVQARELGFQLKIHADEFEGLGGTALACELGAVSADHLVTTPEEDIAALGRCQTVAVSLPGTPFGLGHTGRAYTPARSIMAAGGALALATDLNPGTCWCESMQFVIALATRYLHLTPAQALAAATLNAACAIGRGDSAGTLAAGRPADLLILNIPDYRHLGYRFGTNLVETVIKAGQVVVGPG